MRAGRGARPLPGLRRDLRPAHLHRRATPAWARCPARASAPCVLGGFSKAHAMTGLAGRLDLRARGGRRAVRAGAPVHDAVRPARLPARRGRGAASTPTTTSPRWSPTTTGGGGCSSRGCASSAWTARSRRGRSTRSRRSAAPAWTRRRSPSGCCTSSRWRWCPGNVFGPSGEGHVRCSYATALPLLEEALERIGRFLPSLSRSRPNAAGCHRDAASTYRHAELRRAGWARPVCCAILGRWTRTPTHLDHDPPCPGCGRHRAADDAAAWPGAASTRPTARSTCICPACTRADIAQIEAGLPVPSSHRSPAA